MKGVRKMDENLRLEISDENRDLFDRIVRECKASGIDPVECVTEEVSAEDEIFGEDVPSSVKWFLKKGLPVDVYEKFGAFLKVFIERDRETNELWGNYLKDKDLGREIKTQDVLSRISDFGFPTDDLVLEKLFNLFRKVSAFYEKRCGEEGLTGNYPVNYDTLRVFCPEFNEYWGIEKILSLTDEAGIPYDDGHMREMITSSNLTRGEKAFLLYTLC